jgi:hypothetical protein
MKNDMINVYLLRAIVASERLSYKTRAQTELMFSLASLHKQSIIKKSPNRVKTLSPLPPTTMPRVQKKSRNSHNPLIVQLDEDSSYAKYGRVTQAGKRKKSKKEVDDLDEENVQS